LRHDLDSTIVCFEKELLSGIDILRPHTGHLTTGTLYYTKISGFVKKKTWGIKV
jgi:hypothetical protein